MLEPERVPAVGGPRPVAAPGTWTGSDPEVSPHVLVIDDDRDIHRCCACGSRRAATTSRLRRAAKKASPGSARPIPDLVFLDVAMSGMTGIDVLDFIRSQRLDVAVILTTAYSSEQVAIAALRHGADDYLRKPFDRGEFQAALDRTLARLTHEPSDSARCAASSRASSCSSPRSSRAPRRCSPICCPASTRRCPASRSARAACRRSAVGGDFYDWQQLPLGRLCLTVGDVMGKGMSAALLMATVRAVIRAMVSQHGAADAVQHTAASLDGDLARSGSFVTLFHAQLDITTGELRYVDAGHGQVFLRRANGDVEMLKPWGLPLGVLSTEHYREGTATMAAGDLLVIYSDGLTEARPDLFKDPATVAAQVSGDDSAAATAQWLVDLATGAAPAARRPHRRRGASRARNGQALSASMATDHHARDVSLDALRHDLLNPLNVLAGAATGAARKRAHRRAARLGADDSVGDGAAASHHRERRSLPVWRARRGPGSPRRPLLDRRRARRQAVRSRTAGQRDRAGCRTSSAPHSAGRRLAGPRAAGAHVSESNRLDSRRRRER